MSSGGENGANDLREFLAGLGEDLLRVPERLSPRFEVAALLREAQATGRALLFEDVEGYPGARIAGNLLASRRLLARALGTCEADLARTYLASKERSLPPVVYEGRAPAQEVVHEPPPDLLSLLPVLTHHEADAAPYITCGLVLANDPETGRRAMGVHRLMVRGDGRLGILLANPPLTVFHARAEALGKPLEVAIALGIEPATLLASVVKVGPVGPDKLEIAGALRGRPLELARARTVDVEVPARAEIVLEGRVLPGVREPEGPFGENTGYYFRARGPIVELSAVTHRRDFIYPALCPWTADVDHLLSLAAGTELLAFLQGQIYGVTDVEMIPGTCGFSAVVAVKGCKPAEVRRLILLALGSDRRLKAVTVVDDDVDLRNPREVSWALATRYQPDRDTVVFEGLEGYVIDPSTEGRSTGAKIGFDATRGPGPEFDKVTMPAEAVARARAVLTGLGGRGGAG
ncbi:MAG: UbiD family decarboxylase [Deltaproteobacteria bacterium]|nr:UbiD family decarboxylase [Deltaproteobacteria bacterium]